MLNIPEGRMETFGLRLPRAIRQRLDALANEQKTDAAKVARAIIEKYFDDADRNSIGNRKENSDND